MEKPIFKTDAYTFFKTLLALQGAIVCWSGAWNVLNLYTGTPGPRREWLYVLLGSLGLIITNSWIANAGLGVVRLDTYNERRPRRTKDYLRAFVKTHLRCIVAFLSSLSLWVGLYNLIDIYLFEDLIPITAMWGRAAVKDIITYFAGLALLVATGAYLGESGLLPTRYYRVPWSKMALWYGRATLAIIGSICYW